MIPEDFGRESSEVNIVYNLFDKTPLFFKRVVIENVFKVYFNILKVYFVQYQRFCV